MKKPNTILEEKVLENILYLKCDTGIIRVTPYAPNILHFAYFPGESETELPMWGIAARPDPTVEVVWNKSGETLVYRLPELAMEISATDCQPCFYDTEGRLLLKGQSYQLDEAEVSGENTFNLSLTFDAPGDEHYYGLGQHQNNLMDHRGRWIQMWHRFGGIDTEVIAIPFLVTNKNYALYFDNCSKSSITPGKNGTTRWEAEVGEALSYFVIHTENMDDAYKAFRLLTGPTPMPPRYSLGFIQCKQRYHNREELMGVARKYREKGYPCDMLVVDWHHWTKLGNFDLKETDWPDARGMSEELSSMGYHTMISCWPRVTRNSWNYARAEANGWLLKDKEGNVSYQGDADEKAGGKEGSALLDTTNPDCAQWFWEAIRDGYAAAGFTSWWLDQDEPDVNPHGFFLHAGTGARIMGVYPLLHTKAVYEGHRRDLAERCLILSRSAWPGAQQYGTTFWSSDITSSWDYYKRQIPAGLNFCASGFAYWSSDIGGWVGCLDPEIDGWIGEGRTMTPELPEDYPELYIRWFQYGAFCPTFRTHGSRWENEVWSYGEEAEKILVKYLELRYRLLPIYTPWPTMLISRVRPSCGLLSWIFRRMKRCMTYGTNICSDRPCLSLPLPIWENAEERYICRQEPIGMISGRERSTRGGSIYWRMQPSIPFPCLSGQVPSFPAEKLSCTPGSGRIKYGCLSTRAGMQNSPFMTMMESPTGMNRENIPLSGFSGRRLPVSSGWRGICRGFSVGTRTNGWKSGGCAISDDR